MICCWDPLPLFILYLEVAVQFHHLKCSRKRIKFNETRAHLYQNKFYVCFFIEQLQNRLMQVIPEFKYFIGTDIFYIILLIMPFKKMLLCIF